MGTTTNLNLPYPEATDPPAGHTQIQALAEAIDVLPAVATPIHIARFHDNSVHNIANGSTTWVSVHQWTWALPAAGVVLMTGQARLQALNRDAQARLVPSGSIVGRSGTTVANVGINPQEGGITVTASLDVVCEITGPGTLTLDIEVKNDTTQARDNVLRQSAVSAIFVPGAVAGGTIS